MRVEDEKVRKWIVRLLRERTRRRQNNEAERFEDLKRQMTEINKKQDRLLSLRLMDEIDEETFAKKSTELRDQYAHAKLLIDAHGRQRDEKTDLAVKVFELSQSLAEKWDSADIAAKRKILDILCLNWTLEDVNLTPTMRKPFDVIAEGLVTTDGRVRRPSVEPFLAKLERELDPQVYSVERFLEPAEEGVLCAAG